MPYKTLSILLLLISILLPAAVFAQAQFVPLVGIPGIDNLTGDGGLNQYINALYRLSISIAALLAVIKIVAAGAKYMLTDIVPAKEDAKKDIQGALIGLLIVIGAIIILNTVNSDLTNLDLELEGVVLDDATVLTGNNQRDAACPPAGCTYLSCTGSANTLQILSGLPVGSSCREMCSAIQSFYYKTETGATECAVNAASFQQPGTNVESIPCKDVRNDPTYINGKDYSCVGARGICYEKGGIELNDNWSAPSLYCALPANQNGVVSSTTIPATQTGIVINPNQTYRVNDPADPAAGIPEASPSHNAEITFIQPIVRRDGMIQVIINQQEQYIGCDLISPPVCN